MSNLPAGIYKSVCPFCRSSKLEFKVGRLFYCPKCKVYTGAKWKLISLWNGKKFVAVKEKVIFS